MATFANSLKAEIARVARKEFKGEVQALRKTVAVQRSEIAAIKRELKALRSESRSVARTVKKVQPKADVGQASEAKSLRFSAGGFASLRKKLGLSQAQMAKLIGASTLSVYKWEKGQVAPRAAQVAKIAGVRRLGKKSAAEMLENMS